MRAFSHIRCTVRSDTLRMFKVSDPSEARGNSITAREILDKSSQEINTGLANDPELQVRLLDAMGHVYVNLGLYLKAQDTFERALTLAPRVGGTRNPAILSSMSRLSFLLIKRGMFKEAESMSRIESRTSPRHTTWSRYFTKRWLNER